jgi:hypothetical protein
MGRMPAGTLQPLLNTRVHLNQKPSPLGKGRCAPTLSSAAAGRVSGVFHWAVRLLSRPKSSHGSHFLCVCLAVLPYSNHSVDGRLLVDAALKLAPHPGISE